MIIILLLLLLLVLCFSIYSVGDFTVSSNLSGSLPWSNNNSLPEESIMHDPNNKKKWLGKTDVLRCQLNWL